MHLAFGTNSKTHTQQEIYIMQVSPCRRMLLLDMSTGMPFLFIYFFSGLVFGFMYLSVCSVYVTVNKLKRLVTPD